MDGAADDGSSAREFLAATRAGDLCGGTIAEVTRSGAAVTLDGFSAHPLGMAGPLEQSWCGPRFPAADVGRRITAEVISVDPDEGRAQLSTAAAENPGPWAFLKSLRRGQILPGTVAPIERFGVFVALDDGPGHPVLPGVRFISVAELSWRHFEAVSDVVTVGQRVACEFLQFDTWNGEARCPCGRRSRIPSVPLPTPSRRAGHCGVTSPS
ncbi:S1 RNA-binding domain-containing protein [Streptomyces sp. NPDC058964]|uniref:S1 RNA-binding domain-containing protein n=1 Tax=Streptomyces sp. NPDC058964 TaxID=3346681 RepID=UPI003682F740